MSNTSASNSTMSTATASKTTKSVPRKSAAAKADESPAAAPAVASAAPVSPAVTSPVPKKSSKKTTAASESAVAAAPAPASAPVTEATAASAVPDASAPQAEVTVEQSVEALRAEVTAQRSFLSNVLKSLDLIAKSHRREVRDAKGRGRRKNVQNATGEKRKTIFTTPVKLREPLAHLLGKSSGFEMSPSEVTHLVNDYMKEHGLKVTHQKEDGKKEPRFRADQALARTLDLTAGQEYPSKDLQRMLYKQYVMPPKAAAAGAGASA